MSQPKVISPPGGSLKNMSPTKSESSVKKATSKGSVKSFTPQEDPDGTLPDFVYGGPFISVEKPTPFLEIATPINIQLQGTFKKSFAYYSLKERMPIILTKVIDYLSRAGDKIRATHKASDEDIRSLIQYVTKLKNDLVTNKKYDKLTSDAGDAEKWNEWIAELDQPKYFTNTWVWTECYVYRRLREGCELTKGLQNFDPFDEQKDHQFANSLEPMCVVAESLLTMLQEKPKEQRKADFITLLKLTLWSNKCDLSLSCGESTTLAGPERPSQGPAGAADPADKTVPPAIDPFQMIVDFKDKLLVDDSGKVYDQLITKTEAIKKAIAANTVFKQQCSCHRLATLYGMPKCDDEPSSPPPAPPSAAGVDPLTEEAPPEPPKIPCPAKITVPQTVMFDIVCDNAGYELFTDLCLATFLIKQEIVQKIRFHVKKIPWFVSDVTPRDFNYVIESCKNASFNREIPAEAKPAPAEGEPAPPQDPPRIISSEAVRQLGDMWAQLVQDGTFIVCTDDYWTYPHVYKDMKRYDWNLYRKLQLAAAVLFKGDLNYRKLLGERNCNPVQGFDPSLQGFNPAPVIAVRTIKADLVCGLPKGKWEALNKIDEKWMEKGDYGLIQFSAKAEALKVSDRPCPDYGDTCRGTICPVRNDL